jgi:alpha-mannosidase
MLAGEDSFISVEPKDLVVTAVKPTEYDDSGIIVRLFNPTGMPVQGTLATGFMQGSADVVNFREELIEPLTLEGNRFAIEVAPYEIMTVRILPGSVGLVHFPGY